MKMGSDLKKDLTVPISLFICRRPRDSHGVMCLGIIMVFNVQVLGLNGSR